MSRKDFIAFAAEIKTRMDSGYFTKEQAIAAASVIACVAACANPRFDRIRFFAACGL